MNLQYTIESGVWESIHRNIIFKLAFKMSFSQKINITREVGRTMATFSYRERLLEHQREYFDAENS